MGSVKGDIADIYLVKPLKSALNGLFIRFNHNGPCQGDPLLLTAGQLSEEQMVALAGLGYQSFVSLREADEGGSGWEEGFAAEKGLHFVRLPIAGADGIDEAHARQLDTLMEAEARPMVLYCGSSNRVGALLALRAFHVQDMGAAESLELGKSTGVTGLESMLEEKLGL